MVTVIIPALNEEKTIRHVVDQVNKSKLVNEILVIDDKSIDATVRAAKKANIKVYTSTKIGKGASMRDGMLLANNEILVYLDADILTYPDNIIELLSGPILSDEADFVKSSFTRQAGRVTELVAKPLLSILVPDLTRFSQPLSGMIAGKKSFFRKIHFENDYGVDVGILLDMHSIGARISEVNIGYIENRMQSWEQLGKMSNEVSRAILKRAELIKQSNLEILENISIIRDQMDFAIKESVLGLKKMIIFDMDYTILHNSFISILAERFNLKSRLVSIVSENSNPYTRTKLIAKLLKGLNIKQLLETLDSIPITHDFQNVLRVFKRSGYICGIISDSYDCITNHLVNKFGLDFSIANELEFSNSVATGEVKIPSVFIKTRTSNCNHDFCKANAMREIATRYKIDVKNVMAIGDSENDICMIKDCGIGIAFCSTNETLNLVASKIITERSFSSLVDFIQY